MRHVPPITLKLADDNAERIRRAHHDAIRTLQESPASSMVVIKDVTLTDGTATPISHGLGRVPIWVCPSPPRGATSTGRIEEIRDGSARREQQVILKATGWGATITIDLAVM